MMYYPPVRSDELYHFGVKGMHWGIRRYQNKDGTLTPAGRKHYESIVNNKHYAKSMGEVASRSVKTGAAVGAAAYAANTAVLKRSDKDTKILNPYRALLAGNTAVAAGLVAYGANTLGYAKRKNAQDKLDQDAKLRGEGNSSSQNRVQVEITTERKGLTDQQKKAIKTGLTIAGVALAAYGAYKLGSNLSDENTKWNQTRRLVNDYRKKEDKTAEASRKAGEAIRDYGVDSWRARRALDKTHDAANKRFDASAKMTAYSATKLNENPNIFQQHANKEKAKSLELNPYRVLDNGLRTVGNKLYKSDLKKRNKSIDWDSVGPQMVSNKTGRILSEKEAEEIIERAMKKHRR